MMMERARAGALEEVLAAHGAWEERFAVRLEDVERTYPYLRQPCKASPTDL